MPDQHECEWGPVELSRITGNPHRKCQVSGCKQINMDLDDDEDLDDEEDYAVDDDERSYGPRR